MANVYFCGFEADTTAEANATVGTMSLQTGIVRTGTYALRTNPTTTATGAWRGAGWTTGGAASLSSGFSVATMFETFFFYIATLPAANDEEICAFYSTGGGQKAAVRINSTGNLLFYDSVPTLKGTGSTVLSTATWYQIDVKCGTSATVAVWEVKINGVSEISGSNGNTIATNNGEIRLGKNTDRNGNSVDFYYDDVSCDGAAYPGVQQTTVLVPNAVGTYQTATIGAGGGANYTNVDEVPNNGNTDYLVTDNVSGDAETEGLTDTSTAGITGTVNAVLTEVFVRNDGASNGVIRVRTRSASTDDDTGSDTVISGAYTMRAKLYTTDPATTIAWTLSGVDGVEVGIVEKSVANKARLTATYLMVNYTPAAGGTTVKTLAAMGVGG